MRAFRPLPENDAREEHSARRLAKIAGPYPVCDGQRAPLRSSTLSDVSSYLAGAHPPTLNDAFHCEIDPMSLLKLW